MNDYRYEPCAEWAEKVAVTYPEEELSPADLAGLYAHLATCAKCRAVRHKYRRLEELIRSIPGAEVQPRVSFAELVRPYPPEYIPAPVSLKTSTPRSKNGLYPLPAEFAEYESDSTVSGLFRKREPAFLARARQGARTSVVPIGQIHLLQTRRTKRLAYRLNMLAAIIAAIALIGGALLFFTAHNHGPTSPISTSSIGVTRALDGESIGISNGTFAFDTNRPDGNLKRQAADRLKAGEVSGAESLWQAALQQDSSDAEALIYLEDQRVLASGSPYITIVVATILTGDNVGVGHDDLQGAYVAQKEFNDGFKLPNSLQVRLLIANSGNQTQYAITVAQQIVQAAQQDHTIVGVMGWPFSSRALVAVGVLARAHIPMVSPTASSDKLSGISPYFFRVAPSNVGQGSAAAHYAEQVLHAHHIALFVDPSDSYSSSLASDFKQQFQADGNHIVVTENYTVGTQGQGKLPALLQDALKHNPDLIYFSGYASDISVLLTNLPTTGPFASLQVLGGDALYELGGYTTSAHGNFNRLHFTAFSYPDEWGVAGHQNPPFFSEYSSAFNPNGQQPGGKYGYTRPSSDVMLSYDATVAMLTGSQIALSSGKSTLTPADLQQGLSHINGAQILQGVSGPIEFGTNGDPVNKPFVVLYVDALGRIHEEGLQGCLLIGHCG